MYDSNNDFIPFVTFYHVEGSKLGVVVCPGGGYARRSEHEGKGYAEWLNKIGVSACVLEYRVAPYKAPALCADVQRGIRIARSEFSKHGVEKVGIMGSSAGGHLAALASVHYDKYFYESMDEIDKLSARPDFSILCYTVNDMHEYRHHDSRSNFLGNNPKKNDNDFYSPYLQVQDNTPPAFLWHCAVDEYVPAENSMLYAMALSKQNIPYELHVYPVGWHGMGLAQNDPYVNRWTKELENWLYKYISK